MNTGNYSKRLSTQQNENWLENKKKNGYQQLKIG